MSHKEYNYELVGFSEIEPSAVTIYTTIHNIPEELNLGDILKVNPKDVADHDLLIWGFPCTQISSAGKKTGFYDEDGNKTSSGLFEDAYLILKEKKPVFSIIENVENLVRSEFTATYNYIIQCLEDAGYTNYVQVLDARDYGIPQQRKRTFIVSIRNDIDAGYFFYGQDSSKATNLSDYLLSDSDCTEDWVHSEVLEDFFTQVNGWDTDHFDSALTLKYKIPDNATKVESNLIKAYQSKNKTSFSRYVNCYNRRVLNGKYALTLTTLVGRLSDIGAVVIVNRDSANRQVHIRPINRREGFRLMGYTDEDYFKCCDLVTPNNLGKAVGNGIVVNVMLGVLRNLYYDYPEYFKNLRVQTLFSGMGAPERALKLLYDELNLNSNCSVGGG